LATGEGDLYGYTDHALAIAASLTQPSEVTAYSDIQERIEEASVSRAITSPLMASSAPDELFPFLINIVGNSSALESGTINTNVFPFGIGQIGINKTSTVETSLSGECASEICLGQIGIIKPGTVQLDVNKTGFGQIGITETSAVSHTSIEIGLGQIGTREVNQNEANVTEISLNQSGSIELSAVQQTLKLGLGQCSINKFAPSQKSRPQIDSLQINSLQVNPIQISPSKISLSSSISPEQFLSIHTSSSNLIALNSTAVSLWQSFLSNFNLTLSKSTNSNRRLYFDLPPLVKLIWLPGSFWQPNEFKFFSLIRGLSRWHQKSLKHSYNFFKFFLANFEFALSDKSFPLGLFRDILRKLSGEGEGRFRW
jgi:hypothetical protein